MCPDHQKNAPPDAPAEAAVGPPGESPGESSGAGPEATSEPQPPAPRIAIVGRPNVGKSTLLNRMVGSRVSIVEPTAGVTRDRVTVQACLTTGEGQRWFEVVDTGGIGIVDRDDLGPHVEGQVAAALAGAHLILFLVDVREGITPLDQEVAARLRGVEIPVVLVVNKCEGTDLEWDVDEFRRLGFHDGPFALSAQNGGGLGELYDRIGSLLPWAPEERPGREPTLKLAVVGRRNAGKSTLINRLAREERMIVSEVPGTTRDAVDVLFERDGETLVAIDTAGVRKKSRIADAIEFYSEARSRKSIRRADVVLLLFDATRPVSALEKNLARYAIDHHKPLVLGANKFDLAGDLVPEDYREYLEAEFPGLAFSPMAFLSAKDGLGVEETLEVARALGIQACQRVGTGELNRVLNRALEARVPGSSGYRVRVRYATQTDICPPTFMLFVNDKKLIGKDYLRYLNNRLREELPFPDVPLRIVLRDSPRVELD
ncbi:MAG: ribosome biogenesis GTPase Der [Planctomycetes bacterium]|nr:ribosome biogenesis GTPase Der [Planctomycetota bacterium]